MSIKHFLSFSFALLSAVSFFHGSVAASHPLVVRAAKIYTATGSVIENGTILCIDGKIRAIGDRASVTVPADAKIIDAKVVFPGLIDVRTCVGLSGILNVKHDSDQLESSSPLQPELRALDAYNSTEELVEYLRSFGVTTVHTGHAPGELISGQTLVAKTVGNSVQESVLVDGRAVAATLSEGSVKSGKQSPGTRGKQMAMLRSLFIEAQEYQRKLNAKKEGEESTVARNLRLEPIVEILAGKKALLVTADRAQDIASALRLGEEFNIRVWLDSAAEAYTMIPQIQKAGVPVLLHPSMARASGDKENMTFQNASKLHNAKIPFAIEGGFEAYVPKVRVVLFEAALAAGHGLPYEAALESITIAPAKILGVDNRVGSIEIGKDADLALYDGDPFEYTTHCIGTIVNGTLYPSNQ